jgi:hypothetical protein
VTGAAVTGDRAHATNVLIGPVWLVGSVVAALTGLGASPTATAVVLGGLWLAFVAWFGRAIGWRAVRLASMGVAAQAPVLTLLAASSLRSPLKVFHFPIYIYSKESLVVAVAAPLAAMVLALPMCSSPQFGEGSQRFRDVAQRARLPMTALGVLALGLGSFRIARFPDSSSYVESLPLVASIPLPVGEECASLVQPGTDLAHAHAPAYCTTPIVGSDGLSFHYHCAGGSGGECTLFYQVDGGPELSGWKVYDAPIHVRWEARRNAWIVGPTSSPQLVGRHGSARPLLGRDVLQWTGPPLGWVVLSGLGLVLAVCLGSLTTASRRLGPRFAERLGSSESDSGIICLALLVFSNALLVGWFVAAVLP